MQPASVDVLGRALLEPLDASVVANAKMRCSCTAKSAGSTAASGTTGHVVFRMENLAGSAANREPPVVGRN
jgi:hypothetical protein